MAQPRPIEQPPVMRLIRDRRKKLHLSYDRAGALVYPKAISGTRWRQLEDGYRAIRGVGYIPEAAPAATLAGMAEVTGVTPQELKAHGEEGAAAELVPLLEIRAQQDGETRAEAERTIAALPGLTARQRAALVDRLADDLRKIRAEGG